VGDEFLSTGVICVKDLVLAAGRYSSCFEFFDVRDHLEVPGVILAERQEDIFRFLFLKAYVGDGQDVRTAYAKTVEVVAPVLTGGRAVLCSGGNVERGHRGAGQASTILADAAQHLGCCLLPKGIEYGK